MTGDVTIERVQVETAKHGRVEWVVCNPYANRTAVFRTRWAARIYASAVVNGKGAETLTDLWADRQVYWVG
jgi:hypothetical protein